MNLDDRDARYKILIINTRQIEMSIESLISAFFKVTLSIAALFCIKILMFD